MENKEIFSLRVSGLCCFRLTLAKMLKDRLKDEEDCQNISLSNFRQKKTKLMGGGGGSPQAPLTRIVYLHVPSYLWQLVMKTSSVIKPGVIKPQRELEVSSGRPKPKLSGTLVQGKNVLKYHFDEVFIVIYLLSTFLACKKMEIYRPNALQNTGCNRIRVTGHQLEPVRIFKHSNETSVICFDP